MKTFSLRTSAAALLLCLGLSTAHAATPGYITGTVVNVNGLPIPNVQVVADNTLGYNSNLITRTDAQGRYSIKVTGMPTTFKVSAKLVLTYPPYNPTVSLVPKGNDVVPGNVGGVVNFEMNPKGGGPYGALGLVSLETGAGYAGTVDLDKVKITLTPVGKLADGTAGKSFTVTPVHLAGWFAINIMYGTYKVSATENGRPLDVREKGDGAVLRDWGSTFTGGFVKNMWTANPTLQMQVRPHEGGTQTTSGSSGSGTPAATTPVKVPGTLGGASQPGDASRATSISGTLSAPANLKGVVVFACVPAGSGGRSCDEGYTRMVSVPGSGGRLNYALPELSLGLEYRLVAWVDVNDDGDVNTGDLLGTYHEGEAVMVPVSGANITLQPVK